MDVFRRALFKATVLAVKNTDLRESFADGICLGIWLFSKVKHKSEIVVSNLEIFRKVKFHHIKICKAPIKFESLIPLLFEWN